MSITLLDCTLRDGAHVNASNFGHDHISSIIKCLNKASLDIIELGFLKPGKYNNNHTNFPYIEDVYSLLQERPEKSHYSLMARADAYNVNDLSECTGTVQYIRIAFYYNYLEGAVKFAREVISKGYRCVLNPINTPGYTYEELCELIECVNAINPHALTIVDTFGVLLKNSLNKILDVLDSKLDPGIRICLHAHENLALSFSLAQNFLERYAHKRDISIDSSLMGIGRIPGNLCTELIADHLNVFYEKNYNLVPVLHCIENDILPIKQSMPWGYSTAYFLSARHKVHRSYSEYLLKNNFSLEKMDSLLSYIPREHSVHFNKDCIDLIIREKAL